MYTKTLQNSSFLKKISNDHFPQPPQKGVFNEILGIFLRGDAKFKFAPGRQLPSLRH